MNGSHRRERITFRIAGNPGGPKTDRSENQKTKESTDVHSSYVSNQIRRRRRRRSLIIRILLVSYALDRRSLKAEGRNAASVRLLCFFYLFFVRSLL